MDNNNKQIPLINSNNNQKKRIVYKVLYFNIQVIINYLNIINQLISINYKMNNKIKLIKINNSMFIL